MGYLEEMDNLSISSDGTVIDEMGLSQLCSMLATSCKLLLTCILSVADFVTDVILAVQYFKEEHYSWAILTTAFVVGNNILTVFLMCVPSFRKILNPFKSIKNAEGKNTTKDLKRAVMLNARGKVLGSMAESGPQCILQLYITLISGQIDLTRALSLATSVLSFIYTFFNHEKLNYELRHKSRYGLRKSMPCGVQLIVLIWKFCENIQRFMVFSLFLSIPVCRIPFLCTIVFHVSVFFIYKIINERKDRSTRKRGEKILGIVVDPLLKIFTYSSLMNPFSQNIELGLFYALFYVENIVFISVWYVLVPDSFVWLRVPVLIAFVSAFVLHPLFLLIYRAKFANKEVHMTIKNVNSEPVRVPLQFYIR